MVICKIGAVAYELDLPSEARIHPVFHVFQFKPKLGQTSYPIPTIPSVDAHGVLLPV
jgi:hypothetical protein